MTTSAVRFTGLTGRRFGIEMEMFVDADRLVSELRAAGVAVEREGYNHTTRSYWKLVTDGSVRDPVTGNPWLEVVGGARLQAWELVSPVLAGEAGLVEVEQVCAALARVGARVNRTCGLHVHHDAADLTVPHIATLARLVNRFERVIDGVMPQSRRKGQNFYTGAFSADELDTIERAGSKDLLARRLDRYRNLNLAAIGRHGTVEFRQHGGTVEADKIIPWIMLTQGMVEHAAAKTRARKTREQLKDNGDGLDNLLRAAGLRSCKPHGHVVAPEMVERARKATAYFIERARHFGVLAVADNAARRSRARRAQAPAA